MIFDEPIPFSEAVRILREKKLFPTDLSSAEIGELDAYLRQTSILSARTTKASHLQTIKETVEKMLSGQINEATGRMLLQESLDELSYDPAKGFDDSLADPAEAGSIRDLGSNARTKLILQTQTRLAANKAYQLAGQTAASLYAFPALELIRIFPRAVPRGKKLLKGGMVDDPGQDWPSRWQRAGGKFYGDGRMIALKDDAIWETLGSSAVFADALDTDVPPFAFNSGFGVRAISREEATRLGVLKKGQRIEASAASLEADRKTAEKLDPVLVKAVLADLNKYAADDEALLGPLLGGGK